MCPSVLLRLPFFFFLLPSSLALGLRGPHSFLASWLLQLPGFWGFGSSSSRASLVLQLLFAVIPAASSIPVALLPCGSESLIASAASWILSVQAFCCFVDLTFRILSHGFCSSWLLLHCGSYCFMASVSFWPIVVLLLHGFCYLVAPCSHDINVSWSLQLSPCFCCSASGTPHPPPLLSC